MSIVLDGTNGVTTNSGTVVSTTDATINGITVGKGGGSNTYSTSVGANAGAATQTVGYNTAIGYHALQSVTSGSDNIGVGYNALGGLTTGNTNVAIGDSSLLSNLSGSSNIAVGQQALNANIASYNVAVGYQAGYTQSNSGASYNTYVGNQAGYGVTSGTQNCFFGVGAGYSMTSGSYNVIIGNYSGNQNGLDIRANGGLSGANIVLSDGNGIIGMYASVGASPRVAFPLGSTLGATSQGFDIYQDPSYIYIQSYSSKPLKINNAGNNVYIAQAYANTTSNAANMYVDSSGLLYRSTSSEKYKQNIQNANFGLADVLKLRAVTYQSRPTFIKDDKGNEIANPVDTNTHAGFIAEEVDAAGLKEFVVYGDDGKPDAIHYGNMVSLMASAIQELSAEVTALKAKVGI